MMSSVLPHLRNRAAGLVVAGVLANALLGPAPAGAAITPSRIHLGLAQVATGCRSHCS